MSLYGILSPKNFEFPSPAGTDGLSSQLRAAKSEHLFPSMNEQTIPILVFRLAGINLIIWNVRLSLISGLLPCFLLPK